MAGKKAKIPVVALTADVMEESKEAFKAAGIDGFVSKPISSDMLLKAIEDAIESRVLEATD
jgi:CheY-like chemotaxis protein